MRYRSTIWPVTEKGNSENMLANIAKNLFWNEKEQLTLITGKRSGGKATTAERFLWLKLPLGIQNDKLLHQNKNKKRCAKNY